MDIHDGYISMTLRLATEVDGFYLDVIERFDRDLFEALKPPVGMQIAQFTGSKKGDQVILNFTLPAKFTWRSDIIEDGHDDHRAWFVDEGIILPWPLKTWRHEHIVEHMGPNRSRIVDLMSYTCSNALITAMIRPLMLVAFHPRKSIYKQYFSQE